MANDKYKEFRNLMFNELQITKADIQQWTREAARESAESAIREMFNSSVISNMVSAAIRKQLVGYGGRPSDMVTKAVKDQVAVEIAARITVVMKD
jgi:hypothetical protein